MQMRGMHGVGAGGNGLCVSASGQMSTVCRNGEYDLTPKLPSKAFNNPIKSASSAFLRLWSKACCFRRGVTNVRASQSNIHAVESGSSLPVRTRDPRERELIDRALQGCNDSFLQLVQPHLASLRHFARTIVQDETDLDDILQQATLRALTRLAQFRGDAKFQTWITTIVLNEARERRRNRWYSRTSPLDLLTVTCPTDPKQSPEVRLERQELWSAIQRALANLPKKTRRVVELNKLQERTLVETAKELSMSVGAARSRLHRALVSMKRQLRSKRHKPVRDLTAA
jgi:RNA polymerase sigma-70 factor (ECF subfamily)